MSDTELPDDVGAEEIPPRPGALIETFRAIGYNLPTAIADIIDNSISAGATEIAVLFQWKKDLSFISISDNGHGMTKDELVEALRPGAENPLADRKASDLGRFGLGLKTASFSQCRRVTVVSKTKKSAIVWRGWDLDYVVDKKCWRIINYLSDQSIADKLDKEPQGTIVLWERLDHIIYDQQKRLIKETKFLQAIAEVEQHLSLVFHRFLEKKKLRITINDNEIIPWDPFLVEEKATQSFPQEGYESSTISMQGYVLPHQSKLSPEAFRRAGTPEGWTYRQGFYIYRKDRILVAGDWLGLFRKDDATRLARIMVDISADLDLSWQLDIRKSRALPPKTFQDEMKRYGAGVRQSAVEVYRHRGKQKQRQAGRSSFEFAWITEEQEGRDVYKVNRNHPLYRMVREQLGADKKSLEKLIRLLEMTLPVTTIATSESLFADLPPVQLTDEATVTDIMQEAYRQLLKDGLSHEKAVAELYFIDPFSNFPHLVIQLTEKNEKN